jgi:hypothetical protein
LAAKYPHLASKILVSPLRASGGASFREEEDAFALSKADNDCKVQSPNRNNCERGRGKPPKARQARGRKPATHTEKAHTTSQQKGDDGPLRLGRKVSSGSHTGSLTQKDSSRKPAAATIGGGAATAPREHRESPDPDLIGGRRPKSGGPYADGISQVFQITPRRSVDVSMAIRATAKHARKQSVPRSPSRHRDAGAAAVPDSSIPGPRRVPERRSSANSRTGYRGRADIERTSDHTSYQREIPDDPRALREYDCMLGSHVLQGDNLVMTTPSVSKIEELRQHAMSSRSHDTFHNASPQTSLNTSAHLLEHHMLSAIQLPPGTQLRSGSDRLPPFANSFGILDASGERVPVLGGQEQILRLEQRLSQARGTLYGDTAFRGTSGNRPYSLSHGAQDLTGRTGITTMDRKLNSSYIPTAQASASQSNTGSSFRRAAHRAPEQQPLGGAVRQPGLDRV